MSTKKGLSAILVVGELDVYGDPSWYQSHTRTPEEGGERLERGTRVLMSTDERVTWASTSTDPISTTNDDATANNPRNRKQPHSKDGEKIKQNREMRLLAVVAVIVVSWLIVKIWADVFELFVRKVMKVPKGCFVKNLVIAIVFTVGILWILYITNIDDMLAA